MDTPLQQLVVNILTKAQYDALESIDPNQLYFISDENTYVLNSQIVTTLSAQSTDSQIPSAKCVYDKLKDKVDKTTETNKIYGTDASGVQTVYDSSNFQKTLTAGTNITIANDEISSDIPTATSSESGKMKLYTNTGTNTDGTMTQNAITSTVNTHNSASNAHSNIRGVVNGVATLDSNGKVPLTQMNDAVLGNVAYQGTWNAATNDPFLVDPAGGLPAGYSACQYITFTGTQYIDTGLIFDTNTIEMEYEIKASSDDRNYGWMWGAATLAKSGQNAIVDGTGSVARYNSIAQMYLSGGNNLNIGNTMLASGRDAHIYKVNVNRNTNLASASVDGVLKTSGTVSGEYSTNTMYLGWIHIDDTTISFVATRWTGNIDFFRVKKDGVLVGDFRPAQRASDSQYGFFDLVTNTFFTNQGTGTFTGGGQIEIPKGYYYITNTAGTQFGIDFQVGDWIISQGNQWGKVANTDAVMSVQGRTGNVTILNDNVTSSDYGWSSNKISTEIGAKIDDTSTSQDKVWSANKVNNIVGDIENLLNAI